VGRGGGGGGGIQQDVLNIKPKFSLHISVVPHNYQYYYYYCGRILFCCHEQLITCTMRFKIPARNLKRREMSLRLQLII